MFFCLFKIFGFLQEVKSSMCIFYVCVFSCFHEYKYKSISISVSINVYICRNANVCVCNVMAVTIQPFSYLLFSPHSSPLFRHYILSSCLPFLLSVKLWTYQDRICLLLSIFCLRVCLGEWNAAVSWIFYSLVILYHS